MCKYLHFQTSRGCPTITMCPKKILFLLFVVVVFCFCFSFSCFVGGGVLLFVVVGLLGLWRVGVVATQVTAILTNGDQKKGQLVT